MNKNLNKNQILGIGTVGVFCALYFMREGIMRKMEMTELYAGGFKLSPPSPIPVGFNFAEAELKAELKAELEFELCKSKRSTYEQILCLMKLEKINKSAHQILEKTRKNPGSFEYGSQQSPLSYNEKGEYTQTIDEHVDEQVEEILADEAFAEKLELEKLAEPVKAVLKEVLEKLDEADPTAYVIHEDKYYAYDDFYTLATTSIYILAGLTSLNVMADWVLRHSSDTLIWKCTGTTGPINEKCRELGGGEFGLELEGNLKFIMEAILEDAAQAEIDILEAGRREQLLQEAREEEAME